MDAYTRVGKARAVRSVWVLITGLVLSPLARAADSSQTALFAGVGMGLGTVSGSEFAHAPGGSQLQLGTALSRRVRHWAFDGELGWSYNRVSGENAQGQSLEIRTRAGYLALGARYRLGDRWQLGPVWQINYGTDTSLSPTVGPATLNSYVGAKAVYELSLLRFPIRLWQQATTDISVSDRQAWVVMAGVQAGIPLDWTLKPVRSDVISVSSAAPLRGADPQNVVRFSLDSRKIFFGTNSAELRPEVTRALRDVGQYLKQESSGWKSLEVSGHADRRGRFAYNLTLSERRAQAVRDALVGAGASEEKVALHAYSYLKPVDPAPGPEAWARNRRVELVFSEVSDGASLLEKLKPLAAEAPIVSHRRATSKGGMN
jgi:outer membrane protein OmpA-like peptidoglycan-associated protein